MNDLHSPLPVDLAALFHPAVAGWFAQAFDGPTAAQRAAWPAIKAGYSTLVAAPTGSGKTLTAFLAALDELFREGLARGGRLPDQTWVLYVSPLKALSNDIHLNLEVPLAGITAQLARLGLPPLEVRSAVRTGDTSQRERVALRKRAPHILVTTPESLYVLLGSDSGRAMLGHVRSVIVDEIHAIAGNKRGSHLALSLERLDALCPRPPVRIGLSATQQPIERVAHFLTGGDPSAPRPCCIVDIGHARARDLAIEVPPVPLDAIMANDVWERVYDRIAELVHAHRTTLVFVNTRRMAERAARHLSERLGVTAVAAHHGSMAKEQRLEAEQRLKRGELRVLIATASLELGIDIGEVELVCQLGSPRSIAAFLQRVGRSRHQVGGTPKGRLFPSSRDDLLECAALLDCVRRGELDSLQVPLVPLDVLAQQIVAEVNAREWQEEPLYQLLRGAMPYAGLSRADYQAVLRMLAEGYSTRFGSRGAYLHRDAVNRSLRGRRGGRLTALSSGGTIPDSGDYAVLLEPQGLNIGTVNEDFAVESLAGDVFQLGNSSYRILKVEPGRVRVEDAQGQPPNIPFWLGEAPGRSDELSVGVARLREAIQQRLVLVEPGPGGEPARIDLASANAWLVDELGLPSAAAQQLVDYLSRARAALGELPTQDVLVMERFFDASGGTQLVIHSPYGSRINRAWGLALRKRFCRTFNFELQAAATEDAIVLSLSTSHSFVLDEVWRYLRADSAEHVLIQALLDAPLFAVRWRWCASVALALPRMSGGRKVAPQLQRMKSEDLLATVFPDQVACQENLVGEREIPDHPLVKQTLDDCLHEAMDCEGWLALLRRMESGAVRLLARDLPAPSPLAAEVLSAQPYAFLDDAPIEERRTQAVLNRRWSDPESADDLGALDPEAIAAVREEAWPQAGNADELHEALMDLACLTAGEARHQPHWDTWLAALARAGRATRLEGDVVLWLPVERLGAFRALYPQATCTPQLSIPDDYNEVWDPDEARVEILRARLSAFGPLSLAQIAEPLGLPAAQCTQALVRLEAQGYVLRGRFSPGATEEQWCERHLLARIHRYTVKRLRREIEPVERADFMRFLFDWQRLSPGSRGEGAAALAAVIEQLEGYQAAAGAWEKELLPARVGGYASHWLDELCRSGRLVWLRQGGRSQSAGGPVRGTPVMLLPRRQLNTWTALGIAGAAPIPSLRAQRVLDALGRQGALFFDELLSEARLLRSELENALGELVALGLVNADSFAGLRTLLAPASKRGRSARRPRHSALIGGMDDAGRWALLRRPEPAGEPSPEVPHTRRPTTDGEPLEHIARVLLRRYGVVCWRLLEREADWLPTWRELLRVYHRLEARGEIRGGRFVNGVSGEQFALPEAVALLREVRRRGPDGCLIALSAADPLNLVGTLLPGHKVPVVAGNRVVYRDGVPVAVTLAGKPELLVELDTDTAAQVRQRLTQLPG